MYVKLLTKTKKKKNMQTFDVLYIQQLNVYLFATDAQSICETCKLTENC